MQSKMKLKKDHATGMISALIIWEDGEWKIEIFPSEEHAKAFAEKHDIEVELMLEEKPDAHPRT